MTKWTEKSLIWSLKSHGFQYHRAYLRNHRDRVLYFWSRWFLELFNRRLRKTRYKNRLTFTTKLVFFWWTNLRSIPFRGAQGSSEETLQRFRSTSDKWRSCRSSMEDRQILHLRNGFDSNQIQIQERFANNLFRQIWFTSYSFDFILIFI